MNINHSSIDDTDRLRLDATAIRIENDINAALRQPDRKFHNPEKEIEDRKKFGIPVKSLFDQYIPEQQLEKQTKPTPKEKDEAGFLWVYLVFFALLSTACCSKDSIMEPIPSETKKSSQTEELLNILKDNPKEYKYPGREISALLKQLNTSAYAFSNIENTFYRAKMGEEEASEKKFLKEHPEYKDLVSRCWKHYKLRFPEYKDRHHNFILLEIMKSDKFLFLFFWVPDYTAHHYVVYAYDTELSKFVFYFINNSAI